MVSVTVKQGKVIVRIGGHQCTLASDKAAKLGLKLLDAAKKAGDPR